MSASVKRPTRHKARKPKSVSTALTASQQEVVAILNDDIFMQPWFVPKPVYLAIRRLLPNIHLMKMRHYFDDYGCLRCGDNDALYGASGLCHACNVVVRSRLLISIKRRLKAAHVKWEAAASDHFFDQMNLAQLILHGRVKGRTTLSAREKPSRS